MQKKRQSIMLAFLCAGYLLIGCQATPPELTHNAGEPHYDQNSWKQIIPDSCRSFYDGCNQCRRSPGAEIAACTRKYCEHYAKPVCLDETSSLSHQVFDCCQERW